LPEQALYLKWRPIAFDEMVGQEHITRTIKNALRSDRIRHAYLFSGPRGTGKTTTARLLAKAINCTNSDPDQRPCNACAACRAVNEGRFLDLIEIDAATHTSVDDVRELRDKIAFAPGEGRFKVYIIDEVHRFSGSAFDALLKTLEEPPDHAIFVLATTELDKVPATIKSRCMLFQFRRFTVQEVADRLQEIVASEGIQFERAALEMVARQGTGSMRDSVSLLDQIVTDPGAVISVAMVQTVLGTASSSAVRALAFAIASGDAGEGIRIINQAMDTGTDPKQLGQQIVEFLRQVMLAQTAGPGMLPVSDEDRAMFAMLGDQIPRTALLRALKAFNEAVNNFRGGWQPQLSLEIALVESIRGGEPEPVHAAQSQSAPRPAQQQTKAAEPAEPEPVAPDPPGTPPLIPPSQIAARWEEVLRTMFRYNEAAPEVMRYYSVHRVEGNVVTLATREEMMYQRINPYPQKKLIVERSLYDVFGQQMRVNVVLIGAETAASDAQPKSAATDDPLIAAGTELGGKVRKKR
jgi:DNA polymerase-3 subunit gamma/tau